MKRLLSVLLAALLLAGAVPAYAAPAHTFADIPVGSWFEQGVMTCVQNGIMVGTGENTFSPNATLTDAESLMLAYRLYDQANGGDGSLLKMPEDYGYIKIVSDSGSIVREGYIGDRSLWSMPNVYTSSDGLRLCLLGYTSGETKGATLTFGGKEYRGTLKHMYRGSGRYEQDNFYGFEPEDPALNDLLSDAYFQTAPPTRWWADLLYTIREKGWGGWDSVFSGSTQIFGVEDHRGGFADLLGAVTDLPKRFDVPSIPDLGEREEGNPYRDHIYEMYESGIVGGVDAYGTFDAEKTLTRAEAAVMAARILDESQRLTTPPKPMPKEGEGYTLTYLRDGFVDTGFEQDTYPYYFVTEPIIDSDGWEQSRRAGFLKLDGSFVPWPESDLPFTLERFGGNTIYWTNIYKAETDEERDRYEVGVLNDDLEWLIQPQYAELWPREGGYAAVTQENRYLLLDEKGNVEGEATSRQELPERPNWTGYYEYWADWKNWGGLEITNASPSLGERPYYCWPDGSPATEKFDFCGKIGPDGQGFVQREGKIYRIQFELTAEEEPTAPAEQQAQLQAAVDRVRIQGLAIGTPLDQLPEELRSILEPVGQPYDGWATEPGKEMAQHYEAPGITIITSRATEEVLRRMVENNDEDYLTEEFGTTDRAAILAQELGREYVEKVILTSDAYALVSGLKVGDSEEQARALGYTYLNGDTVGAYGSTEITWKAGVVTQIEVWDSIGRRVGPFFDP